MPVTASTGRPISSCTCSTASITTSRALRLLLLELLRLFDFDSAPVDHLVVGFLGAGPRHRQPVEQVALHPLALLGPDDAVLLVDLELDELALDVVLVVELAVRLLCDLLGHPGGAADRRQGQQDELLEQAHGYASPIESSTKLCGGKGPVPLTRSRPPCDSAMRSSSASNPSSRSSATRKDAFTAMRSCMG